MIGAMAKGLMGVGAPKGAGKAAGKAIGAPDPLADELMDRMPPGLAAGAPGNAHGVMGTQPAQPVKFAAPPLQAPSSADAWTPPMNRQAPQMPAAAPDDALMQLLLQRQLPSTPTAAGDRTLPSGSRFGR